MFFNNSVVMFIRLIVEMFGKRDFEIGISMLFDRMEILFRVLMYSKGFIFFSV